MCTAAIIGLVQIVVAVVGLWLAIVQLRTQTRIASASHFSDVLSAFCDDKIRGAFSRYIDRPEGVRFYIESNDNGEPKFKDDETEMAVDRMLLLFENICYQAHFGVIQKEAFSCFRYQIWETLKERQIQRYIEDLARYCATTQTGFPYSELVEEGTFVKGISIFYDNVRKILV